MIYKIIINHAHSHILGFNWSLDLAQTQTVPFGGVVKIDPDTASGCGNRRVRIG